MTCPLVEPLDALIEALADEGYKAHFNEIDARMARSPVLQMHERRSTRPL
jgi:hypothetical protein